MEKLGVGIIGCGGIANGKHMPAIKKLEELEMVAFCDVVRERAEKAAKEFGVSDAKIYTDYRELLSDARVNNVRVLTPNRLHAQISIDAMRAGKHVLCEKPMAASYADALAMLEVQRETGMVLTVGYQHKFDADVIYAKKEADKNVFGEIYFAKGSVIRRRGVPTWGVFTSKAEQGGGALIDIGTHVLDIVLHLMNNYRPRYAVGSTYDKLKSQKESANPFGPWDAARYDVEEAAFGYVVMENGATVILETSWALNTTDTCGVRYMVCGSEAGADNYGGSFKINGINNDLQYIHTPDLKSKGVAFYNVKDTSPTVLEQQVFTNAILGKGELVTKPEHAAVVTRILEGIYISAETGKPYYFE
ncbi:MAG: Gfo/Idh/MocA family oxidoreductase [Ruminococcaceae bacterium]|nr:Gfo/Idh/MocA family oxidoreductase [Oscillospiraceae bacterium]